MIGGKLAVRADYASPSMRHPSPANPDIQFPQTGKRTRRKATAVEPTMAPVGRIGPPAMQILADGLPPAQDLESAEDLGARGSGEGLAG